MFDLVHVVTRYQIIDYCYQILVYYTLWRAESTQPRNANPANLIPIYNRPKRQPPPSGVDGHQSRRRTWQRLCLNVRPPVRLELMLDSLRLQLAAPLELELEAGSPREELRARGTCTCTCMYVHVCARMHAREQCSGGEGELRYRVCERRGGRRLQQCALSCPPGVPAPRRRRGWAAEARRPTTGRRCTQALHLGPAPPPPPPPRSRAGCSKW